MEALRVRYEREKNRERAFLYSQRLHLIVLEGRLASLHEEMMLSDTPMEEPETSDSLPGL